MRGCLRAGGAAGRRRRARGDRRWDDERGRGQHPRQRQGAGAGARARAPVRPAVARARGRAWAGRRSSTSPRAAWSWRVVPTTAAALARLTAQQRAAGVVVDDVDDAGLFELEPNLARDVAGGAWYPQDAQVQPMLATAEPPPAGPVARGARGPRGRRRSPGSSVTTASGSRACGPTARRSPSSRAVVVNAAGHMGRRGRGAAARPPGAPRRGSSS